MQFASGFTVLCYGDKQGTTQAGQDWARFRAAQDELKHFELALRSMLGVHPRREDGQSAAAYLRSLPDALGSQADYRNTLSCIAWIALVTAASCGAVDKYSPSQSMVWVSQ